MAERWHPFARSEVLPSYWVNSLQAYLSTGVSNFSLQKQDATTIEVPASANAGLVAIAIQGNPRWRESPVTRAHPGGAAGTYDIFVTAKEDDIRSSPAPYSDFTDYNFNLAIVASGSTPTIVPGTVDVFRKVGELVWDGSEITQVAQTVGIVPNGLFIEEGPFTEAQVDDRLPDGSTLFETNADGDIIAEWVKSSG